MSGRLSAALAWGMWVITLTVLVPTVPAVNVGDGPLAFSLLGALVLLAYATVGALIASRHPRNAIGWLLAGSALLSAIGDLAIEYGVYALLTQLGALPGAAWMAALGGCVRSVGFFLILTYLLLLFPTGHLPSPRWRPLAWITPIAITLFCVANLLTGDLSTSDTRLTNITNPLGVLPAQSAAAGLLNVVGILLIFACAIGCCASVVVRFRRAVGLERQQLKWLVYAALWAALAFFAAWVGVFINNPVLMSAVTFDLCLLGIPVAMGIAILRHRLFDIDLIINRTLVYGSLTAILAAVYFGCVLGAQAVVKTLTGQTRPNPLVIVLSTLLIAALFAPLRRRLQAGIDRRFYRRKYDAAKTLAGFSATLRSQVDLTELQEHLLAVTQETMQPAQVSLWLRPLSAGKDANRDRRV